MKRTVEKLREREKAEELGEIINSIRVGKIREAFSKIKRAGKQPGSQIKRCLSSDGNLYQKVQPVLMT